MHHVPPLVRALLLATVVVWAAAELRQAARTRAGARHADAGSRTALRVLGSVAVVVAIVFARTVPATAIRPPLVAEWARMIVMWFGIALRLWCFHVLGQYFTFTVQTSADQRVVESGPYRVVRHPSYLAIIVILTGVGLLYGNWLSVIAIVVLFGCGIGYRIRVEERALLSDLGQRYADYASTHKRLVPFVW